MDSLMRDGDWMSTFTRQTEDDDGAHARLRTHGLGELGSHTRLVVAQMRLQLLLHHLILMRDLGVLCRNCHNSCRVRLSAWHWQKGPRLQVLERRRHVVA